MNVDAMGDDPHDLVRFIDAQKGVYEHALAEIKGGRKRSHWMWFVFPQFAGLGSSSMSERYAINSVAEARAYLHHAVLGPHLSECAQAALALQGRTADEIFGSPDDMKLRSCATLFASVSPPDSEFQRILDRYFQGEPDPKTLELLATARGVSS